MRRNPIIPLCFVVLLLIGVGACKRHPENQISRRLITLAEKINTAPDTMLANGMMLTGCSIDSNDSLFTYQLTVPDARFNSLTADSLKHIFADELKADSKQNLLKVLCENSLGIKYVCILPDTTLSVVFSPAEIAVTQLEKP